MFIPQLALGCVSCVSSCGSAWFGLVDSRWHAHPVVCLLVSFTRFLVAFLLATFSRRASSVATTGAAGGGAAPAVRGANAGLRSGVSQGSDPAQTGRVAGGRPHQGSAQGEWFLLPLRFFSTGSFVCSFGRLVGWLMD